MTAGCWGWVVGVGGWGWGVAIMAASRVLGSHIEGCFEEDEKVRVAKSYVPCCWGGGGEEAGKGRGENEVAFDRR